MLPVLIRFPCRAWAESAISELAAEDCAAELLPGPDREGAWTLLVNGPAHEVRTIRQTTGDHSRPFCWEAFLRA